MIVTKTKQEAFKKEFNLIPSRTPDLRSKIRNVTVKLMDSGRRFKATGVILSYGTNYVTVLTALHNLYVLADKTNPPEWSDALVTSFKEKIKIYYGAHDFKHEPANEATITLAKPIHLEPSKKNWEYDVLMLRSETPEFKTYAATAGNAVYASAAEFSAARAFVTMPFKYLNKGTEEKPSVFVQTGYGKVVGSIEGQTDLVFPADMDDKGDNAEGKLQYRITSPAGLKTTSVYQQVGETEVYNEFKNCIVLSADANDSTEAGDSGGPLFIAQYDASARAYKLYLIGLTLGSDLATTKIPCPADPRKHENNVATSLESFYNLLPA